MLRHSQPAIQVELAVNQPCDAFEQEAERVADPGDANGLSGAAALQCVRTGRQAATQVRALE